MPTKSHFVLITKSKIKTSFNSLLVDSFYYIIITKNIDKLEVLVFFCNNKKKFITRKLIIIPIIKMKKNIKIINKRQF